MLAAWVEAHHRTGLPRQHLEYLVSFQAEPFQGQRHEDRLHVSTRAPLPFINRCARERFTSRSTTESVRPDNAPFPAIITSTGRASCFLQTPGLKWGNSVLSSPGPGKQGRLVLRKISWQRGVLRRVFPVVLYDFFWMIYGIRWRSLSPSRDLLMCLRIVHGAAQRRERIYLTVIPYHLRSLPSKYRCLRNSEKARAS